MRKEFFLSIPLLLGAWVCWLLFVFCSTSGIWLYHAKFQDTNLSEIFRDNTSIWVIGKRHGEYWYLRNPVYPDDLKVVDIKTIGKRRVFTFLQKETVAPPRLTCDERIDLKVMPHTLVGSGKIDHCVSRYFDNAPYAVYTVEATHLFGANVLL